MKKWKSLLLTAFLVLTLSLAVQINAEAAAAIDYLSSSLVGISLTDDNYAKDVQLLNASGTVLQTKSNINSYATFSLSKNKLYYLRYRYNDSYNNYYTQWSSTAAINTVAVSKSLKSGRKIQFKAPKTAGVKSYKLYISKKSSTSGYKLVKTMKPGKKYKIAKYRGKKWAFYKQYYYYIVAVTKTGQKAIGYLDGFYLYRK